MVSMLPWLANGLRTTLAANPGAQTALLLYLGPETVMPLASILAAIVGVLLIFWRLIAGAFKRLYRFLVSRLGRTPPSQPVIQGDEADEPRPGA